MVLPLMAAGMGILGGASFLMGKYNERRAEDDYRALERDVQMSGIDPGSGNTMLAQAQDSMSRAGFFDWAEGRPNGLMQDSQQSLLQFQAQKAAKLAAAETQWNRDMFDAGIEREETMLADQAAIANKYNTFDATVALARDALDTGDAASMNTVLFKFKDLLDMGVLTDSEGNRITQAGGLEALIETGFNQLARNGRMSEITKNQLRRQVNLIAKNMHGLKIKDMDAMQSRFERNQRRYGEYMRRRGMEMQSPFIYGLERGDPVVPLTPAQLAEANKGLESPNTAVLTEERSRELERVNGLLYLSDFEGDPEGYKAYMKETGGRFAGEVRPSD